MELFYTKDILNERAFLDADESHHCIRVLRHSVADTIYFTNGMGVVYSAKIVEANPKKTLLQIESSEVVGDKREYYLHMAVALTKNIERFEWFLEKAVEIGVDRVTPLVCEHSERRQFKYDRAQRIALSAMKQSNKSTLPLLDEVTTPSALIEQLPGDSVKIMGHCREGDKEYLPSIISKTKRAKNDNYVIMIGPEGDFSTTEISMAIESGFSIMDLGYSIMRVETAALTTVSALYLNYLI